MGTAKDRIMEIQSRGWYSLGDKYVCSRCIGDYSLRRLIYEAAQKNHCDYCGRSSGTPIAAPADEVLAAIVNGITEEYTDVETSYLPYESAEGGWQGETYSTGDVLHATEVDFRNDALRDDIIQAITTTLWCQCHPFRLSSTETLLFSWEEFCRTVKHKNRYFISEHEPDDSERFGDEETLPARKMLKTIGKLAGKFHLVKRIHSGTHLVRARDHSPQESLVTSEQLGPPRPEIALRANRVSPPGVSLFYGSLEEDTSILEVLGKNESPSDALTVATWTSTQNFYALDLTAVPAVPSIFDPRRHHLIPELSLLNALAADFSAPVKKDGREHIDYVPTQVVTEYFRRKRMTKSGRTIKGILYGSCKRREGNCIVVFASQDDLLACPKPILTLVPGTTRKITEAELASLKRAEECRSIYSSWRT